MNINLIFSIIFRFQEFIFFKIFKQPLRDKLIVTQNIATCDMGRLYLVPFIRITYPEVEPNLVNLGSFWSFDY